MNRQETPMEEKEQVAVWPERAWIWFCSKHPEQAVHVSAITDDEYDYEENCRCGAPLVKREFVCEPFPAERMRAGLSKILGTLRAQVKDYGTPRPGYSPSDQARAVATAQHQIAEELEALLLPAMSEAELARCAEWVKEQEWDRATVEGDEGK